MSQSGQIKFLNIAAVVFPFIAATGSTLFLFYIDEGLYSFKWMQEPAAWIVFGIYVFVFYTMQILFLAIILRKRLKFSMAVVVTLASIPLGFGLLFIFWRNLG